MARAIHIYGVLAKVQGDAKKHTIMIEIDPEFWDRTPELVEIAGDEITADICSEEHDHE